MEKEIEGEDQPHMATGISVRARNEIRINKAKKTKTLTAPGAVVGCRFWKTAINIRPVPISINEVSNCTRRRMRMRRES